MAVVSRPASTDRELVREFYGLLGQPDEVLLRVVPGFIQHQTGRTIPWVGRERFREHLAMLAAQFSEFRFDLDEIVTEGSRAAVRYTMRGTTRTGKKLELPGMDFLRLKDGLIEEVWGIFDRAVLRDQLGPSPHVRRP